MKDINEYIALPQAERQAHLKLDEPCIDRGGWCNSTSFYCKGLLAHLLDTTIPTGHMIHVCHACHNAICTNPNHLYWGTAKENFADAIANGRPTIHELAVAKYGVAKVIAKNTETGLKTGHLGGKANKGKPKSPEHRRKISESLKKRAFVA